MSRILVVEDSRDNFDLVADALDNEYVLECATSGQSALQLAKTFRPDLVLLDMGLPDMDGWQLARQMRATPELAGVPLVALTAHAMDGDRQRCLDAGCDDYIAKPIDVRALPARIGKHLRCERAH